MEARDLTYQKVALIEENASRMGTVNVKAVQWDATEFDPASENKADLVIADLPAPVWELLEESRILNITPQKKT